MDDISNTAAKLNNELKNSETYMEYLKTKETLYKDPEAVSIYEGFMEKHLDYKTREFNNEPIYIQERRLMSSRYSELILNTEIREFLEKKKNLTEMLNSVSDMVFEGIDVEM